MTYERIKILIFLVLATYCFIGLSLRGSGKEDVYPIFTWSYFSGVPNPRTDYTIEISRYGRKKYDPPLRFSQTKEIFDRLGASATEYTPRIRDLGSALSKADSASEEIMRAQIEMMFEDHAFEYTVLEVFVDPVEYWKHGAYEARKVLGTFSSDGL